MNGFVGHRRPIPLASTDQADQWRVGPRGFSLVELTVVLLVLGLVLAGIIGPLSAQQEARRVADSRILLEAANEALLGYAMQHGGLPCPAPGSLATGSNGAGLSPANCIFGPGQVAVGVLPWATLGLPEKDAWGHRITYALSSQLNAQLSNVPQFTLSSSGAINIYNRLPQSNSNRQALGVPFVLVSHGKLGLGAFDSTGNQIATGTDARVIENSDVDNAFVSQSTADDNFDHIVRWTPMATLIAKMVQSGKLP
ncbi:prepilin-type N-terminal cleavage/methylation domain-containing protein [Chitinivorax tropicus]|uniref:Prepilin-type N-terminal cleavage/methylation domain-containing protein n=1 Tax=Chitinivorax tropicus TaxID=714531 RepID=A0A840MWC9_9PROT|nr:prepilin-type N-terminal cleavage/methylation domain-containing protein [Chitinivorax tropicus]MBB5019471.1 prepilin-type N-terminal cleavage/methylation domain-containing protein [Chitinivorax tropicus]